MRNHKWQIPLIFAALLAAILLPGILTGYSELHRAEAAYDARDYAGAAELYESAARRLPWRRDLWEKAGISAGEAGNLSRAIDLLLRAPKLSQQGWIVLGYCYFSTGDLDSALAAYQSGLDEYGPSAPVYHSMSLIYRARRDWVNEGSALEKQLALDADDAASHYRLGLLLTVLEPSRAAAELTAASSLDPEYDSVLQTLRAALELSAAQTEPSSGMVVIGRALGLVNEWELAHFAFENAVEADAENAEAWAWLGEANQQLGQDGRAELDKALALDNESVIVRGLRGLYWSRQENYAQALAEYLAASVAEPENPAWQASIGEMYARLGDLVAALAAYQRATELAPADSTYWRLLALFCADNAIHIEDIGLPAAQKAAELAPNDIYALDALGYLNLSSGRYFTAEGMLLDVVSRDPNYLPAHLHLAMAYLAQGKRTEAFNELTYVRDADSNGANGQFAEQMLRRYFP
jgi:tetratricopeptide (TPR) repeat protein